MQPIKCTKKSIVMVTVIMRLMPWFILKACRIFLIEREYFMRRTNLNRRNILIILYIRGSLRILPKPPKPSPLSSTLRY